MKRYKLLLNNINLTGVYSHDYSKIDITFTPNLPKSLLESIEAFNALNGGVSEQTRLKYCLLLIILMKKLRKWKMSKERLEDKLIIRILKTILAAIKR